MFLLVFCIQVKSVCEECLSLVNTANIESGPENVVGSQPNASISQTTKPDVEKDHGTRKYFEVRFCELFQSKA